ncbi:Nodulin-like protein [Corchorus olitorius]|uniref:Nodulin-like protein n=1 Tax=Corchorus olitorius TaxID=93759 RepID=A0A1R3KJL0_9ROSI|nr:Nodulin-like protein [Corchorus olitorius]
MAGAGATYLFGVYSKDIKSTLGYDQSTLNLLSTFKDLGANVGILSGLIAEQRKEITAPTSIIVEPPALPETASKSEIEPEYSETKIEQKDQDEVSSCCANICNKPKRGEDYSILQALLSIDMLLLFLATFCGQGCSLTAIDNLGQIGESLGYPHKTISTFVSLLSIWNYFGRVFAGFVSEIIMLKYKIPRPLIMAMAILLSAVGDILIAFPWPGSGDIYKKFRDEMAANEKEMALKPAQEMQKVKN